MSTLMSLKRCRSLFALAVLSAVATAPAAQAPQVEFPAASPTATLKQRVGLTDIEIVYSRPGVKERDIFGGLVAYGEVWRTGANQPTKITFSTPVKVNGADVPAGTYALYTIPGPDEWTVILHKNTALWGSFNYDPKDDLVRVQARPVRLEQPVETLTIDLNDLRDESATLELSWDRVRVPVKIELEVASKLVPQIEAAMASAGGEKPYFPAAMFYFNHDLDLQKARAWIDAAVKANPDAYYIVHWQAKILARVGEKEAALAAATRAIALARDAKDSGYVKLNEDLIASLR